MSTATTKEVRQIEVIPLGNVRSSQSGDRCKDVESLSNSIKAIGLISPIIVRRGKGATYDIVAGHRRFAAVKAAGLDDIRAIVFETDDNLTEVVRVSENLHRLQMTPFEEAEAIAKLRKLKRSTEEIAADLGVRPQYVARRERLTSVIPEWLKRANSSESSGKHISIAALELIALFEPSVQKQLLSQYQHWSPSIEQLRNTLSKYVRRLKAAPWKLDDSLLVPGAGACNVCPKRSSSKPLLFYDEVQQKKIDAEDSCLEPSCWEKKRIAQIKAKFDAAKSEHKDLQYVRSGSYDEMAAGNMKLIGNAQAIERHKYDTAKKDAKGAKPALLVDGPNAGQVIYITTGQQRKSSSKSSANNGQPKARTAEEDRKARRGKIIIEKINKIVMDGEVPEGLKKLSASDKLKLFASIQKNCTRGATQKDWREVAKFKSLSDKEALEILSEEIVSQALISDHSFAVVLDWIDHVRPFAETVLCLNWSDLEAEALKAIPDPKPKAGAKKAGKK